MMFQPVRAQFQDLQLWADFTVRYDVNSKLRISLEEELRYFENISRLDKFNSELLALYRFNRTFDAGIFYRLITNRNPEGYYYLRHRFGMVAQATRDYGPWEFRIRLQGQSTYPDFFRSENWQVPENYLRLKFSTSRETRSKKIIPFTDIEFWYAFRTGQSDIIDKYRLTAGIDIRQDIRNRWSVFYRLNQELQVNNPLTAHILGIGYTWIIR
jgi:hypothetical protein